MPDLRALDNPVWIALTTEQHSMAFSAGLARRFPKAVSPLAALQNPTRAAFSDLITLVGSKESVGLFTSEPLEVPDEWEVVHTRPIEQMICTELARPPWLPFEELRHTDVPEMLALTAATQPGPFLSDTIQMGRYFGIRSSEGKLIAMAGERLRLDVFTEISAVCTDPTFRGRGHARKLVASLAAQALDEGKIPFLHVKSENSAKALYQKIGFRVRREIQLTLIVPRTTAV